jgi:hypothetical protein
LLARPSFVADVYLTGGIIPHQNRSQARHVSGALNMTGHTALQVGLEALGNLLPVEYLGRHSSLLLAGILAANRQPYHRAPVRGISSLKTQTPNSNSKSRHSTSNTSPQQSRQFE